MWREFAGIVVFELLLHYFTAPVIIAGIVGYIGKILLERQKKQLQSEIEDLKNKLDYKSHITKKQFDHEFDIYKEIWACLLPLRIAVLNLRPIFDSFDPKESKEERMRRRLQDFFEKLEKYRDTIEVNKPFYSKEVYESLVDVLEKSHYEAIDYEHIERSPSEYWRSQKENHKNITEAIDNCCEKIRNRISSVEVR